MSAVSDPPPATAPESGVIEEARERQARHRGLAGAGGVALVGIGLVVWGASGGLGGAGHTASHRAQPVGAASSADRGGRACAPVYGKPIVGEPSRSLLSILAVLRRPATPADSLPPSVGPVGDPFVRYVRRTRVIDGRSYYLYPSLFGCEPGHQGLMDLATRVALGGGTIGGVGGGGASAADIEAGRDVSTGSPGSATSATITMVVPDGVASVVLRYPAGRPSGYSPKISPAFAVTARPIGNEVVVRVPRSAGGGPIWAPSAMIWRMHDGHGRVTRVFHTL